MRTSKEIVLHVDATNMYLTIRLILNSFCVLFGFNYEVGAVGSAVYETRILLQ